VTKKIYNGRFTEKQVVEAILLNKGLIYNTAQSLGCTRQTVYDYRDKYESVRQAIEDARYQILDVAEDRLFKAVESGEPWAIPFMLRTIGKSRGYVERQEVTGDQGGPVSITIAYENTSTEQHQDNPSFPLLGSTEGEE
jgi:hypothetical protein